MDNLQVHQLPIERVGELGTTFDQIVCTGVLHHLSDPDAGLMALRDVLEPTGAMQLMVYAPYGRTGIYMLQQFCRQLGIRATDDEIRDLVAALKALPPGHPLERLLREAPDFQHDAAIADALLHPQDRAYSVPQFFDFIERGVADVRPVAETGAVHSSVRRPGRNPAGSPDAPTCPGRAVCRGRTFSWHDGQPQRRRLPERQPRTARRSVLRATAGTGYVPLRMSDTKCIQERLPPGAAAVLLYPGHTFRDLIMPINAIELSLFEAIDGNRTIGDIVEERLSSPGSNASRLDVARRFFERLWWYDQVVFDTSRNV